VAQTQAARVIEGVELPPAGTYRFDPTHTTIGFVARHMLSKVRGRFDRFDGTIVIGETLEDSYAEVELDAASIETKTGMRDDHLRSADFLDVEKFPTMKFVSKKIEAMGEGRAKVTGDLTLHGVTKPVTLEGRYNGGYAGHPFDPHARVGFSARGTLKRSDFGISMGIPSAANHYFGVGDDVEVQLETEFSGPPLQVAQQR